MRPPVRRCCGSSPATGIPAPLSASTPAGTYAYYSDERPSPYFVGRLARQLNCTERELVQGSTFRIPRGDREAVQRVFAVARQTGQETFQADYRAITDRGEEVWVHNHATRFVDKQGDSGYIHFLTDITHERALLERLKTHLEQQLKEQERLFDIVARHSNRTLYAYDLATRAIRAWNAADESADELLHLYTGTSTDEEGVRKNSAVMLESVQDTVKFFEDIHAGVPTGELNIHIRMKDGELRWFHFRYSTIFEEGVPVTALLSTEDITDRHEHELQNLLEVVAMQYPGVVMFNLTQNFFSILSAGSNVDAVHVPDRIDVFWEDWSSHIHPDDLDSVASF